MRNSGIINKSAKKPKNKPRTLEGLKTRRAILELLKFQPSDAQELSRQLNVTGMAVRQHLYQLLEEKLVTFSESPSPVGRPSKLWALTPEAAKFFPDAHASLACAIIDNVTSAFGPGSITKILDIRTQQHVESYKLRLEQSTSLKERLTILAKIRTEEGYMAELVVESEGSYLLLEHHCPICSAAKTCRGLCDAELKIFQTVLEDLATVERIDHILAGANRCAYRVVHKDILELNNLTV
jgi:predicted ArsR family transcriptional regulator